MFSENSAGIGVIDIWRWSLDRPDEEIARLRGVLSEDERARADQFYKPRDTARFIAGRGILRHVLASYVGKTQSCLRVDSKSPSGLSAISPTRGESPAATMPPQTTRGILAESSHGQAPTPCGEGLGRGGDVRIVQTSEHDRAPLSATSITFSTNEFGKPAIDLAGHPPAHFNLSHSDGEAVLAVSERFQLGIDIEAIKPLKEDIANRFFSKRECAALEPLRGNDDLYFQAFFRCWTRKEAFVKAHGAGLTLQLDSFDVTIEADRPPALERLEGDPDASWRWKLAVVDVPSGFAGALAVLAEGESFSLRYRSLSEISLA
jgi:phosphopantetheinyl transferase